LSDNDNTRHALRGGMEPFDQHVFLVAQGTPAQQIQPAEDRCQGVAQIVAEHAHQQSMLARTFVAIPRRVRH
jgi:hypothetical protein